jgi:hypothetical protein
MTARLMVAAGLGQKHVQVLHGIVVCSLGAAWSMFGLCSATGSRAVARGAARFHSTHTHLSWVHSGPKWPLQVSITVAASRGRQQTPPHTNCCSNVHQWQQSLVSWVHSGPKRPSLRQHRSCCQERRETNTLHTACCSKHISAYHLQRCFMQLAAAWMLLASCLCRSTRRSALVLLVTGASGSLVFCRQPLCDCKPTPV